MPSKYSIVLVLFFCSLTAVALDSLRMEKQGQAYLVIHRVDAGETLYSLSRRYGAPVSEIVNANEIQDNQIALNQELKIPVEGKAGLDKESKNLTDATYHTVQPGETLYGISRQYVIGMDELKKWNQLQSNELAIGQKLKVSSGPSRLEDSTIARKQPTKVPPGFVTYLVQSGDLLGTIARKYNVRPDSIVIWNDLSNTYLEIGQSLLIKGGPDSTQIHTPAEEAILPYGKKRKLKDAGGFLKVYEEGTARKIEDVLETQKYLALHRTLAVGSLIEVRNLMNNQKIFVRVVGKLPETGLNKNVLIRLTPICFDRLGVIDPKTRVEVSYYEE